MWRRNAGSRAPVNETRRAAAPAVALAMIAAALQLIVLVAAPRTSPLRVLVRDVGVLDYSPEPFLALPLLSANFVHGALGADQGATPPATPLPRARFTPAPTHTPTPSPSPTRSSTPLLPAAQQIHTFMSVSKVRAKAGDIITYEIVAHNNSTANFTGEFQIETHTPLGSSRCTTTAGNQSCATPGDYDGSSTNANDNHLNPQVQVKVMTVNAHTDKVLYSLVVQISQAVPSGTVLHNHAHVTVAGAGKGYVTSLSPDVVVQ